VVFATLQIPITDMGKALQRSKRYDYQVKQAALDAEYLQEKLQLLEGKLRLEMESAWNQLQVTADAVEVATRLLAQMRTQYAAGRITASELMRVSLEVNTARENLLSRRIAYRKALRAYQALQS
jgi:outer membrane protein TolC